MQEAGTAVAGRQPGEGRAALSSLVIAGTLALAKLIAGLASGSLSLLSEAAHSALDVGMSLMALFAITVSARPPDEDHPYGHGKAQSLSALAEAIVLLGLSAFIAKEGVMRLAAAQAHVQARWWTFGVALASIVADLGRTKILRGASHRHNSPALLAGAANASADVATSAGVLAGLFLVRSGHPGADSMVALGIAGYVAWSSITLGRRSVDLLMDRTDPGARLRIGRVAAAVAGVQEVRRVRVRNAGGQPQADVVVGVSRAAGLERAHVVTEQVEAAIRRIEPGADVVVHVEPVADEASTADQIVSLSARHPQVSQVHNVFVALRPDGLHISLHAKFPAEMPLAQAHELAERLEAEIAAEVPGVARVDTHLEPLDGPLSLGEDATGGHTSLVAWVRSFSEKQPEIIDCHEVVVTGTAAGLSVVIHCSAPQSLSVGDAHQAATRIEQEVHRRWHEVERVTVHLEPAYPGTETISTT